ncbi:hypothetical protein [Salinarimonas ramus]|uniref:Uncharacterized protein n=1 Tax=Salinarimonas ramus TaxID=690164 RepID=A0A917Q3Y9_9HYPH|nr:hypothetical protein [Salinarimonas ramus]GGK19332.1 hypothetical protein GCM10011322_02530 [Salinarimonas ramus]
MSTIPTRRRGLGRTRSTRRHDPRADAAPVALEAHASHLKRAAQSAGEAFAWSAEENVPPPRGYGSTAMWLAVGVVAGLGLYVAF